MDERKSNSDTERKHKDMNVNKPEKITDFKEHNINLTLGKTAAEVRLALGICDAEPTPTKNNLTPKQIGLRKILEAKIIGHLKFATREGLGKGDLKKLLMEYEDSMNVSINTVKDAVNRLVKAGKIECVNPGFERGLRFRVKNV